MTVNEYYLYLQALLAWLATQPFAMMLVGAAILWIVAQWANNKYAGGIWFERRNAWISTSFATLVVFLLLVVPNVTLMAAVGILAFAGLASFAFYQKTHWK